MKTEEVPWELLGAIVATVALIWFCMLLSGCGGDPRPLPPAGGGDGPVTGTLRDIGSMLSWGGAIGAACGAALWIVSLAFPAIAPFAAIFRFAAIGGSGVSGTGISFLWLSDNTWALALASAASVGAVVWWYWPSLARLLRWRLAGSPDRDVNP